MKILVNILFLFFFATQMASGQIVVTVAGQVESAGHDNGPAFDATFNNPHGIAIDNNGNVYTSDRWSHLIRKITPNGIVSIFAGIPDVSGDVDGDISVATFNEPWGLCIDTNGDVLVADTRNNKIRKISQSGVVTTIAGSGSFGTSDGIGANATFGNPTGIEVDASNNIYVADHLTHIIRKIDPTGFVTTIAGTPSQQGATDGPGPVASFYRPYGLTLDDAGNIYVADEWNHKIRKINTNGVVSTFAGNGILGSDDGDVANAAFNFPWDITIDSEGNVFVADGFNYLIRKISNGVVNSFAGSLGTTGSSDGTGSAASFSGATGVAISPLTKEIFVGDAFNNLVRKIIDLNQEVAVQVVGNGDNNICENELLEIVASPDIYENYFFYVDEQFVESDGLNFSTNNLSPGTHEIRVIAQDNGNTIQSSPITITVHEPIEIDFQTESTDKSIGQIFEFELNTNNVTDILWEFGDNNTSTDINPTHIYEEEGIYTVSVSAIDENGCEVSQTKSDYVVVSEDEVTPPIFENDVFIPTAFTPNGDGQNDVFLIRGSNLSDVNFSIFNKWGEEIFVSKSQLDGWNGEHNGTVVQNGNYVYCATYTTPDGKIENVAGKITVLK